MKNKIFLIAFVLLSYSSIKAQVYIKTEYFGSSSYHKSDGETNTKVGDSKGSAMVFQGGVHIPLSQKLDENNRPTSWSMNVGGSYTRLNNKNFTDPLVIDEIVNLGVSLNHLKPLNEKWSLMTSLGVAVLAPTSDLSKIGLKNVLGNLSVVFIRHLRPNLDIGGGLSVNNVIVFPMAFPAFYLHWTTDGKYDVQINLNDGIEMSVGHTINKSLRLQWIAEMNGQVALLEQNGKDKIFSHLSMVTGIRPEFKIGKKVSISVTGGINAWRPAKISDRTLKGLFNNQDYHFSLSPYASAGINIDL